MGILLRTAMRMRGGFARRAFDTATCDPQATQAELLREIIKDNRDTVYGKKHNFSQISTPQEFAESVPISKPANFAEYVDRMRDGEENVLTKEKPVLFNVTSGTTDRPKYVPYTPKGMAVSSARSRYWLYRAMCDHPACFDHSLVCITGAAVEGMTSSGIPYGSASGMMYESLPRILHGSFALPFKVARIANNELRYYVMARMALGREVSFLITPNPMTLIRLAETGIRYQDEIVRSVRDGRLCVDWPFDRSEEDSLILDSISSTLRADNRRAALLERVVGQHGRLLPSACWEKLALIGCWLGGSIGFQARRLSEYFGKNVPVRDLGYLASEGSMTVPCEDNTSAGALALDNNYYEFVPADETPGEGARTLQCHELEEGRHYKVILTNHNGLYRYDIHDIVEVRGFYNRTPQVAFVRKGENMLSITGEKLHVNQVVTALERLNVSHGISVKQFKVAPDHAHLRHDLLIDIGEAMPEERIRDIVIPAVDGFLCEANIEYASKRKSGRLNSPCVHIMSDSWAEAVHQHFVASGQRDAQYKWRSVEDEITELDKEHVTSSVVVSKGD